MEEQFFDRSNYDTIYSVLNDDINERFGKPLNQIPVNAGDIIYESMVNVIPVDSLDEVLKHALVGSDDKVSLVERLALVIDTISNTADTQPSA